MTREAALVPATGGNFGIRVRERSRRWWGGSSWSDWMVVCEPGHNGSQCWAKSRAQELLDAVLENGWVPDRYHGFVLPVLVSEDADAD